MEEGNGDAHPILRPELHALPDVESVLDDAPSQEERERMFEIVYVTLGAITDINEWAKDVKDARKALQKIKEIDG